MKRSSGPRKTASLSEPVNRHLNMYALAASAAGVSMLALAPGLQAKIVYKPAHVANPPGTMHLPLDLNRDGIADFYFINTSYSIGKNDYVRLNIAAEAGNAIFERKQIFAAALPAGARIGPNAPITSNQKIMASWYFAQSTNTQQGFRGPWANSGKGVKNRYLGLKFTIKGKLHFGWARLSVAVGGNRLPQFNAILTGYAYETIPNKAIITGKTTGQDVVTVQPASLGRLAQGSAGRLGR